MGRRINFLASTLKGPAFRPVPDSSIQLSNTTVGNATTERHGYLRRLSGEAREFLNGLGNWAQPGASNRLSNPSLTQPDDLEDGDAWIEASGVTPNRIVSLKVQDGGVIFTIASITY